MIVASSDLLLNMQ